MIMDYYTEMLLKFLTVIKSKSQNYGNNIDSMIDEVKQNSADNIELFFVFNRVYNYSFNHNVDDMLGFIFKD
jgi:hypothetical protein